MDELVIKINDKVKTFKDIIGYNLKILFVGLNPSPVSLKKEHYHQGKLGKRFWERLKEYGILRNVIEGREDQSLLQKNFGITDLVKKSSPRSNTLTEKDYLKGRKVLGNKILKYKPKIVCFIYKKAAEKFLNIKIKGSGKINEKFGSSLIFLLPGIFAGKPEVRNKMHELKMFLSAI